MAGRGLTGARGAAPAKRCGIAFPTATPENTYTVQIGSAIGTHVGPGTPSGRLLGADDLHLVSRAIPGSLAMAVLPGAICIMTLGRTNAGINKAESFQGRRSAVRFSWLHLPRDLVQPNVDSIYLRQCAWYQTDEPSVKDGVQMVILLVDHAPLTYGGSCWCVTSWSGGMSVWVLFIGGGTTYLSNAYPGDVIPFCMMLNNDTSRYSRELPGVRNVTPGLPKAVNDICIPTAGAIAF